MGGLTNNEVKFLVTLDIDEDKSKKKIDSFMAKTLKEHKITFDVAVGKSETSINNFLKKHKEKNASLVFDVAVGKSNKNITNFLTNRKQDTQSLIFYVNENATKAKVNSTLSKMEFNPAYIEFTVKNQESLGNINRFITTAKFNKGSIEIDVKHQESLNNINRFIDNAKPHKALIEIGLKSQESLKSINTFIDSARLHKALIEIGVKNKESLANINKFITESKTRKKMIELDVNSKDGFTNINNKITSKQLSKAKLSLSLDNSSFEGVNEALKGKIFKGATFLGSLDVEATKQRISSQIKKMKLPKITVNVEPVITKVVEQPKTANPISQPSKPTSQPIQTAQDENPMFNSFTEGFNKIQKGYKELGQTVKLFNSSRMESEEQFINNLKRQGKQLDIVRDAQTGQITKITSTYKNSANEIQKDVFQPITRQFQTLDKTGQVTQQTLNGFINNINKLKNTEKFNLTAEIEKFKAKLEEARHTATATAKALDTFGRNAERATSKNQIDKLTNDLQKHQAEMRKRNQLEKEQINLIARQQQLHASLTRTEQMYLRTVKKEEANAIRESIKAIEKMKALTASGKPLYSLNMGDMRQAKEQMIAVESQIKSLTARATEASKQSMGIIASLKTAMEKFPIWMIASTAFYGAIGTFREFGSIIVDIDTKMTGLKKVMAEDTDFGAIFDQATASAETFGKTISETLDAYNMFAKQGFKGEELETLSNAGLVAGNVGDIEAGKASEYLTASILQWDKNSGDAMGVVDSWNEISNNFATTVENLAQGQAKAGATARALGMDFDQLNAVVGTLNARTKQSGNEIGNFVKSTFSNILSNKAGTVLDSLGVSLENEDGSMRDLMDVYKDVAKEYVKLDQADKNRVTLGLAGKYHISRMQTLLDDLGKADSMYEKMYQTSQKSANSAMSENQKYMQSLEARINLARVEIEKLALAVGEAFMTEGMVQALQAFRVLAESITNLVNTVGFLPVAFLGVVSALALFSNRFGDLISKASTFVGSSRLMTKVLGSQKKETEELTEAQRNNGAQAKNNNTQTVQSTTAIGANTQQTNKNTTETDRNTEAKNKAGKASKFLSLGFGAIGVASLAVGYGLEKLIGWLGKARQEQENFQNKMQEQLATYEQNKDTISELVDEYDRLSEANVKGELDPHTDEYTKYVEIQNELVGLMPELKAGEDGLGNSISKNTGFVRARVEMLERQLEAQIKLNEEEAKAKQEEDNEEARDIYEDSESTVDKELKDAGKELNGLKNLENNYTGIKFTNEDGDEISLMEQLGISKWGEELKSAEQLMKAVNTVSGMLNDKEKLKLSDGAVNTLQHALDGLTANYSKVETATQEMIQSNETLRGSFATTMQSSIQDATHMSEEAIASFDEVAFSALSLAENEESFEIIADAFSNMASKTNVNKDVVEGTFGAISNVAKEMQNDTTLNLETFENKYKGTIDSISSTALKLSGLEKGSAEYAVLEKALGRVTNELYDYEVELIKTANESGKTKDSARELLASKGDLGDGTATLTDELAQEIEELKELSTFYEQLTGISEAQVEETDELIFMYKQLADRTNLTARENEILEETMSKLNALYPHLNDNGDIRADNIEIENEATKALHEAYQASKDGILDAEELKTLGQAEQVFLRLRNLQKESEAIQAIQEQYAETAQLTAQQFADLVNMGAVESTGSSAWLPTMKSQSAKEIVENSSRVHYETISSLMDEVSTSTGRLNSAVKTATEREKEREKATKESAKEQTALEKITGKYAITLEKLNTALQEVQAKQKKYPTWSKEYRKAIAEENSLLENQLDLNKRKSADLQSIPNSPTIASGVGSVKVKPSGWSGATTSKYASTRGLSLHTGIDIDGAKGDALQANINGTVLKAGNASKIGESWTYGNLVIIQDENSNKHYYAHLDDIAVVKGQQVTAGMNIGTIGNSGNVVKSGGDGSHLHYEVRNSSGKTINPSSYVNQARAGFTSSSSSSSNSTEAVVWNYFKSKGLSDSAVAGIMGNIQQESGFKTTAQNSNGAYGLVQWLNTRKTGLNNYASSQGKSSGDLQVQLDYIWKELTSTEKKALASLQQNLSAQEHAVQFNALFERSGEKAGSKGYNNRVNNAQSFYNSYSGTSGTPSIAFANGEVDHSQVASTIEELKREDLSVVEQIQENYYAIINSELEEIRRNIDIESDNQARQDTIKEGLDPSSRKYEDAVNKQYSAEKRKLALYEQEQKYLQNRINSGTLNLLQVEELKERRAELQTLMLQSQNAEKEYFSEVVGVYLQRYDNNMDKFAETLAWEEVKIQSVDKASERYGKTLDIMVKARNGQVEVIQKELEYSQKMLKTGKLTQEMYEQITERVSELKREAIETREALHQLNYDAIQTLSSLKDEEIDDVDFEISKAQSYRGIYEDGSADQKREMEHELVNLEKKLNLVAEKGREIQESMKDRDLGHAQLQELEEQLEDNAQAYLDVKGSIIELKEELKDFDEIIDEQIKDKREEVIDDILDTLKDSYSELRDIESKRYEDLIEEENKRHDNVMDNYNDELEAFNKIIDAKRREIEDEDRDRTHDNAIDELTADRQELQSKLNLLSNVNTYEGKKEKEELEKQIAELDKQIAEEKYQYEKDLRLQQLDDELEEKTEHIEDLIEAEDEHSKGVLERLEDEKEYWEQYYDDILNDEREFERLRENMLKGHFGEIQRLFDEHALKLTESLPELENTFGGTMEAVGTQIRENVIYELQNLIEEINRVEKEVADLNKLKGQITNEHGSSVEKKPQNNLNDETGKLKEADLKVILAKFMNEQIAGKLDYQKDSVRYKNIKDKSYALAQEGRDEGASIKSSDSLSSIFNSMNESQIKQVGDYFKNNASASGFKTQDYIDYIEAFGKNASGTGQLLSTGDKQVLFAKYMREKLMPIAPDSASRSSLDNTSSKLAQTGRNNLSLISSTVGFDSQISKLSSQQTKELGEWFMSNSGVVGNSSLRSRVEEYGERLKLSGDNQYVGLDTGGMTKAFGSSGGMDGKGGKMALLHEREIVLNPLDTERILKVSSIMDSIMRTINGVVNLPNPPKVSSSPTPSNSEVTNININIAKLNGTQSDIDNLAKQIQNRLLREKGKR